MHAWPKFLGSSPCTFRENDLNTKKFTPPTTTTTMTPEKQYIYLASALQARQMSRFCFAGETKMEIIMTGIPVKNTCRVLTKQGHPTKMVKVTFDLPTPPTSLTDPEGRIHPVHPCRIPYLRCNNCQKHGHTIDKCPSNSQVCPHCAGSHTYENCTKKHNPNLRKCANCSSNNH